MLLVAKLKFLLLLLLLSLNTVGYSAQQSGDAKLIIKLQLKGVIGPASSDYITRSLDKAIARSASAILIQMDTPGGLDLSMRQIIKKIIASPIPIITYVSPGGARAASAGTYILYASHIAAMAPATNLGAATPVQIGGFEGFGKDKTQEKESDQAKTTLSDPMKQKVVNDAAAYIRGLAKMHDRNIEWAEKAVTEAQSLSAEEALKLNVIDMIASDEQDLLNQLHDRKIKLSGHQINLSTVNSHIETLQPDWRNEFLSIITNPSIAYVLLMIGIYGLVFEFSNPGSIVPGTIGGISLLLAMYALQLLPVNYAGMALLLLGIALMIAEAFVPSFGILGLGGIAAFCIGSVILLDTDIPGFGINLQLIAAFAFSSAAFILFIIGLLIQSKHSPVVSGQEEMVGCHGVVMEDFDNTGMIRIHSENWQATCDHPLQKGQRVRVKAIEGLLLEVTPI